jgi:hypothetical protein
MSERALPLRRAFEVRVLAGTLATDTSLAVVIFFAIA